MKITQNMVVALSYELEVEGQIADKATEENPLEYIQGNHMLIQKFENEVEGLTVGDSFSFTVSPEEGYGVYDENYKFDIPKTAFMVDGQVREDLLVVGRTIPMLNTAGDVCQGVIAAVKEDTVTMDFNHPMAGKTLNFSGKIVSVREATSKELTEGLHGEFLPKEEGGCHGKGGCCHKNGHDEEGCCHGEGHCKHGEGEGCCHGEGEEGHNEGCCHGEGHCKHD